MNATGQRLGANEECVFCGGKGGVAPDQDGHHCLVCGAPRVLVDSPVTRVPSEKPDLVAVQKAQRGRMAWSAGAAVSSFFGVLGLAASGMVALFTGFTDHGPGAVAAALAAVVLPFATAALGFTRARQRGTEVKNAYERARLAVTGDLVRARGALDAGSLSRMLHVSADQAEQLLALAEVDGLLGDTGVPETRLRVDDAAPEPDREAVAENHHVTTRNRH
jgi:hypothetical protein